MHKTLKFSSQAADRIENCYQLDVPSCPWDSSHPAFLETFFWKKVLCRERFWIRHPVYSSGSPPAMGDCLVLLWRERARPGPNRSRQRSFSLESACLLISSQDSEISYVQGHTRGKFEANPRQPQEYPHVQCSFLHSLGRTCNAKRRQNSSSLAEMPQSKAVGDYGNGTESHRRRADHRVDEVGGGKRDGQAVVHEGEKQILPDGPQGAAGQS